MPTVALPVPKLQPLIRLLGSSNDNECLAAARGVARVLAAQGLSWHDIADALATPNEAPARPKAKAQPKQPDWPAFWAERAESLFCEGSNILDDRDLEFLENVRIWCGRGRSPSAAQRKWINDIAGKLKVARR